MEVEDIVSAVTPPEVKKLSAEAKWKAVIAGGLIVTAGGLALHVAIACGYIAWFPGFSEAGEVKKVEEKLTTQMTALETRLVTKMEKSDELAKTQRLNTLKKDLLDIRQKQCKTPSGPVRAMMLEQLKAMQDEYATLEGKEYTLVACSDF